MPLKEIIDEIKTKSARDIASIHEQAEAEVKRILDESKAQLKAISESESKATESALISMRQGLEASAEIEAHKLLLEARESAVEEETKRIRSMLIKELSSGNGLRMLVKAAAKELKRFSARGLDAVVVAGPKTYAQAKSEFGDSNLSKGVSEGIIIRSKDQKVSVDLTIEGIADSMSELMSLAIMSHIPMPSVPKPSSSATKSAKAAKTRKRVKR
jgi:vacuolar-type H+-ATPase subunit E/Vma4